MEENPKAVLTNIEEQLRDLVPLNTIRTETVISKLPIHNLAKKGSINIKIIQKDAKGEMKLYWEVSPSRNHGEPRQLAYKLDTLVINRRLDDYNRPLPAVVRLGSLRQIGIELNNPTNTESIKKALHQNAGAYITAKLAYTANDGSSKRLETGFTRYSVVFTGQKLPSGEKADAVYLILNEPYREVLNNAPVRPLNYDYLRELAPGPQRFYEIVSYRIYGVLKRGRSEDAKLCYSEYCTYSAQQRYFDYEHFKKQMYKVHRPHLASGYLKEIRYAQTQDGEGKVDWFMYYTPGPKARAEYHTFTRSRSGRTLEAMIDASDDEAVASESRPAKPRRQGPRQKNFKFEFDLPAADDNGHEIILAQMIQRGIAPSRARSLLSAAHEPELLIDQLEWGDEQIRRTRPGEIRNPAGFYIYLLSEHTPVPAGFETSRRRRLREEAQREKQQAQYHQLLLEDAYREYTLRTIAQYIEANALHSEVADLVAAEAKAIRADRRQWPADTIAQFADVKVRERMKERIGSALMTFDAFCQSEHAQNIRTETA